MFSLQIYIYMLYIYICLMFTPMCRSARFCWGGCAPCWREAGGSCEANEAFAGHGAAGGSVESPWEIQLTLGMGQAPDAGHAPEHMSERMPYGMSECMFRRHLRPHTGDHWSIWTYSFCRLDCCFFVIGFCRFLILSFVPVICLYLFLSFL